MIKKIDKSYIIFAVLFTAVLILNVFKLNLGCGSNDEALSAVIPLRLSQGDALIADEWHVSQMASFLTLPFFMLGKMILGSTEGILLFLRTVYFLIHTAFSIAIFFCLRKYGRYSAVFAAVLYYTFIPFNVITLSYNTMGLACVTMTGVLLSVFGDEKKYILVICGLLFAAAVICNPYMAAVFLIYTIAVIISNALKKAHGLLKYKSWLLFTSGCAALAAVFLVFVLSRASISEIIANLPGIFDDPEHEQISFFKSFLNYLQYNLYGYELKATAVVSVLLLIILFTSVCSNKKRREYRAFYMIGASICAVLYMTASNVTVMFPLAVVGLFAYILLENKPKRLFFCMWMLGLCYSVCMNLSSNQRTYIINSAMTPAAVASIIMIGMLFTEMREEIKSRITGKAAAAFVCAAIIACFGFLLNTRFTFIFADDIDNLDYKITQGPAKGLVTSEPIYNYYNRFYEDLAVLRDTGSTDNILIASDKTWLYLCVGDMHNASFSPWLSGETDQAYNRLMTYYSLHPDKLPKYVYLPMDSRWNWALWQSFAAERGYSASESDIAYTLTKE